MAFSGEYMVPIEDAQKLERELADVKNDLDFRRDLYKLQEMQLAEIAEQRDGLRAGIDYASDQLTKVKEQRDGLHELHNKNAARSKELLDLCGTLRKELTAVTKQRDELAKAIANHNGEALHASTTESADNKLWSTLADMKGLNYE
jgi:chromosome segregation ATPase